MQQAPHQPPRSIGILGGARLEQQGAPSENDIAPLRSVWFQRSLHAQSTSALHVSVREGKRNDCGCGCGIHARRARRGRLHLLQSDHACRYWRLNSYALTAANHQQEVEHTLSLRQPGQADAGNGPMGTHGSRSVDQTSALHTARLQNRRTVRIPLYSASSTKKPTRLSWSCLISTNSTSERKPTVCRKCTS